MDEKSNKMRLTINIPFSQDLLHERIVYNITRQKPEVYKTEQEEDVAQRERQSFSLPVSNARTKQGRAKRRREPLPDILIGSQAVVWAAVAVVETGTQSSDLVIELKGTPGASQDQAILEMRLFRLLIWRLYTRLIKGLE